MNLMNHLSIKSRLLLLVVCPLLFSSWLGGIALSDLYHKEKSLNMYSAKVQFADDLSRLAAQTHQLKLNQLYQRADDDTQQQLAAILQVLKAQLDQAFDAEQHQEFVQILEETQALLDDFAGVGEEDFNSWVGWMTLLQEQLFQRLESEGSESAIPEVEHHLAALYQLIWFQFWAGQDNWYASVLSLYPERVKGQAQKLWVAREKQAFYIERFLRLYATPTQVQFLQRSFFNPAFVQYEQPRAFTESDEDLLNRLEQSEVGFQQVQDVTGQIRQQLVGEIQDLVQHIRWQMVLIASMVVMAFLLMCYLGGNIAARCFTAVNRILATLKKMEHQPLARQDSRVLIDGNDEFTAFFQQLNGLIEERRVNQNKLLHAKEQAEQANVAKSSFLANMSHEIRTPLNGIIGISELLEETQLNAAQQEYLSTITTSSHTLLLLINDILDVSKIESGKLFLVPSVTDVSEVVYDTASIILPKANQAGLRLAVELDAELPRSVLVDEHRLRQILMNLMSNAVKFTAEGRVLIQVRCEPLTARQVKLTFLVEDTGIGIEPEKQTEIFAPFIQEDGTITRRFGGTGLGLAICHQLVALMGGEMSVESEKSVGSRFSVHLTVDVATAQVPADAQASGVSCLLLGDDPVVVERLEVEMQRWGMRSEHVPALSSSTDLSGYSCVVLFSLPPPLLRQYISQLRGLAPKLALVLCCQHDDQYQDIDLPIDGLLVQPLFGQRLVRTVLAAIEQVQGRRVAEPESVVQTPVETTHDLILVAEDSPVNQRVAALFLEKAGFEFELVDNGQAAVEAVKAGKPYRAVLMDCMMPVMDGLAATRAIRGWEQEVSAERKLPIIAVTASVLDEDIQECFNAGMDDYVAKPYRKEVLIEKLKALN
ncbi:hybrid sensor histidine kinase/response regulator [Photobacterium atrarenae]|uniref:histidine kinase n=1 Tax=Photobacterium atrarenae TaxID=865757 RepID=A0ABY5GMH2_9GAMM|nr:ATP-binding protein [Photobacterium atrarenae]UTV30366.1 ATP-binding protein [Photobacterium atrarenae]